MLRLADDEADADAGAAAAAGLAAGLAAAGLAAAAAGLSCRRKEGDVKLLLLLIPVVADGPALGSWHTSQRSQVSALRKVHTLQIQVRLLRPLAAAAVMAAAAASELQYACV